MAMLQTILAFLVALTVLIFVHEFGHYWVARKCGVKILRFSIGFGKVLISKRFGADQTEWSFSAIPLGGYVKMLDEREEGSVVAKDELHRAFNRQTLLKRSAIVIAGPLANFLLAILLYAVLGWVGVSEPMPVVDDGIKGSAAAKAGVLKGDRITSVDGNEIRSWNEVRLKLLEGAIEHRNIDIQVQRVGESMARTLQIDASGLPKGEVEKDFVRTLGLELQMGEVSVNQLVPASRAEVAGLKVGDVVIAVEDEPVVASKYLIDKIRANPEKPLNFKVKRGNEEIVVAVTPVQVADKNTAGESVQIGRIGASLQNKVEMAIVRHGAFEGIVQGVVKTWDMSIFSLRMMGKMLMGELSLKNLSGPISIADYAGQSARVGWHAYVAFMALISISLGVLNLMPIPVLDGGHLVYYGLEALKGKPLSERFMSLTQKAGVAVVLTMMVIAVFNDISRLVLN